jgi:hypothetical protein
MLDRLSTPSPVPAPRANPEVAPDPIEAALAAVLRAAANGARWPDTPRFLSRHPLHEVAIRQLLADGGYLVDVSGRSSREGKTWHRLALTLSAIFSLRSAAREVRGIRFIHRHLRALVDAGWFENGALSIGELHTEMRSRVKLPTFARRLTLLVSPRLAGGFDLDPGYAGLGHACGVVDPWTGYFERVWLSPTYLHFALPSQEDSLSVAAPEVRAIVGSDSITIYEGSSLLAPLRIGRGSCALAVLINNPGESIHALDIQSVAPDCDLDLPLDEPDTAWLDAMGLRVSDLPASHRRRLSAVLRRLAELARPRESTRARWEMSAVQLREDLESELRSGSLRAEFHVAKNSERSVRRALGDVLAAPALASLRGRVHIGEWCRFDAS